MPAEIAFVTGTCGPDLAAGNRYRHVVDPTPRAEYSTTQALGGHSHRIDMRLPLPLIAPAEGIRADESPDITFLEGSKARDGPYRSPGASHALSLARAGQ